MPDKLAHPEHPATRHATRPSRRLDSWKEIADYLKRDVRTTQRWESERNLPVHRVPGGKRHSVFAYTEEMDAWLTGQPADSDARANPETIPVIAKPYPWRVWSAIAVLVAAIGAAGYFWSIQPGPAARVEFADREIRAWDAAGRLAWKFEMPYKLEALATEGQMERYRAFVDLDGDGRKELVVAPPSSTIEETGQILCFDLAGNLLWTYQPQFSVRFGERNFDGPWQTSDLHIIAGPQPAVWVSYHQSVWWPAFLVRIDPAGNGDIRFVHAGWMLSVTSLQNGNGTYLLAGGISNEKDSGMLAVIAANGEPAAGPPASDPAYACANCPRGAPIRYYVLPRSEINRLLSPSNNLVQTIFRTAEGAQARTVEVQDLPPYHMRSEGAYDISADLTMTRAAFTDIYWNLHRRLEEDGKLHHRAAACPEWPGQTVRLWTPESGWSAVKPPRPAERVAAAQVKHPLDNEKKLVASRR